MHPTHFIEQYEQALKTQRWQNVRLLMHNDIEITFSNGDIHKGLIEVQKAYERNFSLITNEKFSISNVCWLKQTEALAIYSFDFNWTGFINNEECRGDGKGMASLRKVNNKWLLVKENLNL